MFESIQNSCALLINLWHAGLYMMPAQIWQQVFEAWAADKVK